MWCSGKAEASPLALSVGLCYDGCTLGEEWAVQAVSGSSNFFLRASFSSLMPTVCSTLPRVQTPGVGLFLFPGGVSCDRHLKSAFGLL